MESARDRFAPASGLCRGRGFCGLPGFDLGQTPARAAGAEFDGLGKGRIFCDPAPRGQMVNRIPRAKLTVGKVRLGHMRLHSFAMGRILMHSLDKMNIQNQELKQIEKIRSWPKHSAAINRTA